VLNAIDPDSVVDFEAGGAVFKLGAVPAVVWQRVKFGQVLAYERAQRSATRSLAKDGLPPDDSITTSDGKASVLRREFIAQNDPSFRAELTRIMQDLLKYGVRGHDNIFLKGEPLKFATVDEPLEGEMVKVVAPETLRVYMVNFRVMETVYAALYRRCELDDSAKKV
jgi:hypothetical protein